MLKTLFVFVFLVMVFVCSESKIKLKYPQAAKVDTIDNYFGVKVNDPYRWQEDDKL